MHRPRENYKNTKLLNSGKYKYLKMKLIYRLLNNKLKYLMNHPHRKSQK